ncbi:MAG: AAA family ATPase [Magnetospirillum sp. WYHS-4]
MITVVGNLKGGTGKSTVAFNLGLWLVTHKRGVQLCDLDPQGTLRDAAEVRTEEGFQPVLAVMDKLPAKPQSEILVDVGLSDGPAMNDALARASRVVIPVAPSQADIWSTQRFIDMIAKLHTKNRKVEILAFLNRADTHPAARENQEAIEALKQIKGITVLKPRLAQRMAFRRSFSEGLGVFELEPRGKAAKELEALARAVFGSGR